MQPIYPYPHPHPSSSKGNDDQPPSHPLSFLSHNPTRPNPTAVGGGGSSSKHPKSAAHGEAGMASTSLPCGRARTPVLVRHTCPHPISDATALQWACGQRKRRKGGWMGGCWSNYDGWCWLVGWLVFDMASIHLESARCFGRGCDFFFLFLIGLVLVIVPSLDIGWSGKKEGCLLAWL